MENSVITLEINSCNCSAPQNNTWIVLIDKLGFPTKVYSSAENYITLGLNWSRWDDLVSFYDSAGWMTESEYYQSIIGKIDVNIKQ